MKKTIYLNSDVCVGCGACVVACMDQNDIDPAKGQPPFRRYYQIEDESGVQYFSMACQHCEDSPCLMACPTGAIARDEITDSVIVQQELCIGCHSCALACPFGVPRYDAGEKLQKCNLCAERVGVQLDPACVRVCPTGALEFGDLNEMLQKKEAAFAANWLRTGRRIV